VRSFVAWLVVCGLGLGVGPDTLRLAPYERILIIAPHPDDEVIACGGLIQQALALGDSVWVVYVTSGDGSWPSAWRVTGNLLPGPKDYLELGRFRREEAKAGAQKLGLDTTQLVFLGYPDAHLARIWLQVGLDTTPIRTRNEERGTRNEERYSGASVVADLYEQVVRCQPDRLFLPHPLDSHSDHWATAALLPAIRDDWRQAQLGEFPLTYYYLVHQPGYPGLRAGHKAELGRHWYVLPLADTELAMKQTALLCHWSQFTLWGPDPRNYLTDSEFFWLVVCDSAPPR